MERYFITIKRGNLHMANKVMITTEFTNIKNVVKELYVTTLDNYNFKPCNVDMVIVENEKKCLLSSRVYTLIGSKKMTEREKINSLSKHDFNILKEFIKACDEIIKLNGYCGDVKCTACPLYHGFKYFMNCTVDFGINYLMAIDTKKELEELISLRER